VIRVGVVRTTSQVRRAAILQRGAAGGDGPANRNSRPQHELRRPGKTNAPQLSLIELTASYPFQVLSIMHQEQLIIAGGLGCLAAAGRASALP